MSIVTYDDLDTPVFEIDFLRYLFANGAQGALWGPLPYYSDAAGTVEADWGDPVGFIPDASGNEQDWTQVTSTARPILGRVPVGGRRNLLTDTEAFALNWAAQNITIHLVVGPDGTMTAAEVTQSTSSGQKRLRGTFSLDQVTTVRGRAWLKAGTISDCVVRIFGDSSVFFASVDLEAGTTTSGTLTDKGDGWFEFSTGEVALDGLNYRTFEFYPGGTGSGEGDGTSSIIIWHPDLRLASLDGPYQRVGNEYDITEAGVNTVHYLRFDGTDDSVTTTLPAISGGTIVLAGTNGIWIDSLDFAGGEFSVGPDTYTDGPAGLMSILGDLLVEGGFVINRALAPKEIAQVKGYYKARGSAGLIELGPEEVVNGTFDENIDGWEPSHQGGSVTLSWDDGAIRMVGPSTSGGAQQRGLYLSDVFVVVEGTLVSTGNSSRIRLNSNEAVGSIRFESRSSSVAGDRIRSIAYLPATGGTVAIYLRGDNPPYDIKWDNISVRKLILPGDTP